MAFTTVIGTKSAYSIGNQDNVKELMFRESINGAQLRLNTLEYLVDMIGGAGTVTLTGGVPAGAIMPIVTGRVTTVIVGPTTNFDIGFTGALTAWGENILLAAGTTFTSAAFAASAAIFVSRPTAVDMVFTADAGTFTSGAVRLALWYFTATAPTA